MKYILFAHKTDINGTKINTYGIKIEAEKCTVKTLYDVSTDFNAIYSLVKRLNEGQVELTHLECILEDFYTEFV